MIRYDDMRARVLARERKEDMEPIPIRINEDPTVYKGGGIDFDSMDPTAGGFFIKAERGVGDFQVYLGSEYGPNGHLSWPLDAEQLRDLSLAARNAALAVEAYEALNGSR